MKKIDIEKSVVRKFDSRYDLSNCILSLGQQGYFSDDKDFNNYVYSTLIEVRCNIYGHMYPFVRESNIEEIKDAYKYFIPANLVVFKEEEEPKKYRPYKDFAEFANSMGLRDSDKVQFIGLRSKHGTSRCDLAYNGYEIDSFGTVYIHLGAIAFTFIELFNNYEYELNSFEWVPFGVEENEED